MIRRKLRFVSQVSAYFDGNDLVAEDSIRDYLMPDDRLPKYSRDIFEKIERENGCYISQSVKTDSVLYISVSFPLDSCLDTDLKRSNVIRKVKEEIEEYFDRMEKLLPLS